MAKVRRRREQVENQDCKGRKAVKNQRWETVVQLAGRERPSLKDRGFQHPGLRSHTLAAADSQAFTSCQVLGYW
jgi:hypothetical protein